MTDTEGNIAMRERSHCHRPLFALAAAIFAGAWLSACASGTTSSTSSGSSTAGPSSISSGSSAAPGPQPTSASPPKNRSAARYEYAVSNCRVELVTDWPGKQPFKAFWATVTSKNIGQDMRIGAYLISVGHDGSIGTYRGETAMLHSGESTKADVLLPDPNVLGPDPKLQKQATGAVPCTIAPASG